MQLLFSVRTIAIAVFLVIVSSVSRADDASDARLICATWTNGKDFVITYKKDGTFTSTFIRNGKWRISKGSLIQESPSIAADGKTVVTVSSCRVTNERLTLTRVINGK